MLCHSDHSAVTLGAVLGGADSMEKSQVVLYITCAFWEGVKRVCPKRCQVDYGSCHQDQRTYLFDFIDRGCCPVRLVYKSSALLFRWLAVASPGRCCRSACSTRSNPMVVCNDNFPSPPDARARMLYLLPQQKKKESPLLGKVQ